MSLPRWWLLSVYAVSFIAVLMRLDSVLLGMTVMLLALMVSRQGKP